MNRSGIVAACFALALTGCSSTSGVGGLNRTVIVDSGLQNSSRHDSLTIIAGPEYKAGGFHEFLFGKHYRDLWTTPTKVGVLDMHTFGGGLIPIQQDSGFQSKSLKLRGEDGKVYLFRSVNKDTKPFLSPEMQNTVAADIVQDQISSSNPAGALIVDVLADALHILHPKPLLVMLPEDERLGQFKDSFAGMLGIIEEYPTTEENVSNGFAGSDSILTTIKLFDTLGDDNRNVIDAYAFLTARLLDVFVGDWDRDFDRWRWARFKKTTNDVWFPIPMDRDEAFSRFDGLFPKIGSPAASQFETFDDRFHHISNLIFGGRFIDRRLLVSLDKHAWDSVATSVIAALTDEVIEQAVKSMPPEFYNLRGEWLTRALKSRRNNFKKAADEYYAILAEYVDVHLSDLPELVEVKRLDDERVEVVAHQKKTNGTPGAGVFSRIFRADETKEIRIYLGGGDDKCVVSGDVETSIVVRVVGGDGNDELVDESVVHGMLWGIVPFIPQSEHSTFFYDDEGRNTFVEGPSSSVDTTVYIPTPTGLRQY